MDLLLNKFFNDLKSQGEHTENTLQAYQSDLKRFIRFVEGVENRSSQLIDLSEKQVKKFLDAERKLGLKPSTLYRRRSSIRQFCSYLVEQGEVDGDLRIEQELPRSRNIWNMLQRKKPLYLNKEDTQKLVKLIERANTPRSWRDLAMINILLETGISIAVLVGLDLADLARDENLLQIDLHNGAQNVLEITASSISIAYYLKIGRPELTQSPEEYALFVSQMGGRLTRQGVWQILQNWGRQADLPQGLTPRLIRHTAVRRMINNDFPIEEIQKQLGHRNQLSTRSLVRRLKASGI